MYRMQKDARGRSIVDMIGLYLTIIFLKSMPMSKIFLIYIFKKINEYRSNERNFKKFIE